MRALVLIATVVALVPLVLIVGYLLERGLGAWNIDFFTQDPTGNFLGNQGGMRSAILGTLEIVAVAAVVAIPFGWGVALYLVEFGRAGRFAAIVRYFVDVMTGVPSIVFGLFIYVTLVVGQVDGSGFAGWKGAAAPCAAHAAGGHPLGRGGTAARARLAARGGARALRRAMAAPWRARHWASRSRA
jgi:phosphate transport system permease protein